MGTSPGDRHLWVRFVPGTCLSMDPGLAALIQTRIEAIKRDDREAYLATYHPSVLAGVHEGIRADFEKMFQHDLGRHFPGPPKISERPLGPRDPLLFESMMTYPVRPTHLVRIDVRKGALEQEFIFWQAVNDRGTWSFVLPLPKEETLQRGRTLRRAARSPQSLRVSASVLLLSNLVPLAGVCFLGWDAFSLIFLYWLESSVIGIFTALKMLLAEGSILSGVAASFLPRLPQMLLRLPLIAFFVFHFGMFMCVHLALLQALFKISALPNAGGFYVLALAASHGFSFFWNYLGKKEYLDHSPMELMFQPYNRIWLMHGVVLIGGLAAVALHLQQLVLAVMVVLKTAADLYSHLHSHSTPPRSGGSVSGPGSKAHAIPVVAFLFMTLLAAAPARGEADPETFRENAFQFTRKAAKGAISGKVPETPEALDLLGDWRVEARVYSDGKLRGEERAESLPLADALEEAVGRAVRDQALGGLLARELKEARYWVQMAGPEGKRVSILGYEGKALEATGDLAVVRKFSPRTIRRMISLQKRYLLRVMHPEHHGFYKFYDAAQDQPESKLRTVYSASSLWTLLKIHDFRRDGRIPELIDPIVGFILSMQVREGPLKGAFHYSFDPQNNKKDRRFVVGTAAKTIFTLLEVYRRTENPRTLEAAREAGNWLLAQVQSDGRVFPIVRFHKGQWKVIPKHSFLYSGQVLSALSRLYAVTRDTRYDAAASRVAERLLVLVRAQDYYVGDDFRPQNPVSTSWAVMSFLDYWKNHPEPAFAEAVRKCVEKLLAVQFKDTKDVANEGRFPATYTSGSGWVNEVLVEAYRFCLGQKQSACGDILQAMLRTTRWLIQNTYTDVNGFHLANSERASGGAILNFEEERVRTDAVCHAANSFVGLLATAGRKTRLELPEER